MSYRECVEKRGLRASLCGCDHTAVSGFVVGITVTRRGVIGQ